MVDSTMKFCMGGCNLKEQEAMHHMQLHAVTVVVKKKKNEMRWTLCDENR